MTWEYPCGTDRLGFCALCYANVRGRSSHAGHALFRPSRRAQEDAMAQFLRNKPGAIVSPQPGNRTAEYPMAASHPALWEYLTLDAWEDGSPRQTSTLSVFWGTNGLQSALNDRDGGRVAFASGDSLEALLAALEHGLQSDSLDWRKAYQGSGQKRRK